MLKNWIVTTKQVKKKESGFINMINYLKDNNRISHFETNIKILNDCSKNILTEFDNRTFYRRENSLRGGGISNYATSFVFSLPRDIKQPTTKEWSVIAKDAIKSLAETNNIEYLKLKGLCHVVFHDESNSLNKQNHIHMLVSNVVDHVVVKGISQFKSTHAVKQSFNYSVKKLLNEDNLDYVPKRSNVKNKPQWLVRAIKQAKTVETWDNFQKSFKIWLKSLRNDRKKATFQSKKVADKFDKLEKVAPEKLIEKTFIEIHETENLELSERIKNLNNDEILEESKKLRESQKITPKTGRKRRRRVKLEP